jgi:hypothetical protein
LRSALAFFGIIFLPLAIWFAWANWRRYWPSSLGLIAISAVFLVLAFDRRPNSWLSWIDDLGGSADSERNDGS